VSEYGCCESFQENWPTLRHRRSGVVKKQFPVSNGTLFRMAKHENSEFHCHHKLPEHDGQSFKNRLRGKAAATVAALLGVTRRGASPIHLYDQ
jgi:hypothetical protein